MSITNQQAAAKIRVLAAAVAAPGTCIVCGSPGGDGRDFLDIDMDIEFYGAVYFCTFCLSETVRAMGFVSKEEIADIVAENETLRAERLEAHSKEKLVNEFLSNIFSAGAVYQSSIDLLAGDLESSGNSETVSESDPISSELDSLERSNDVPSITGRKLSSELEL
jgi:hypothetical protein